MSEANISVTDSPIVTDSTIKLRDGRVLAVAWVGKSGGFPIFHCHGHPSSRLEVALLAEVATALGVQLFCVDRPGIGRSSLKENYRILDWPADMVEVIDQLGIERFAIQGVSGGAAYALACAYKIPERLTACGLVSPLLPCSLIEKGAPWWMRATWWVGTHLPWLYRSYISLAMRGRSTNPVKLDRQLLKISSLLPKPDRDIMRIPETRKRIAQGLAESPAQGERANLDEVITLIKPWGFKLEEIQFEKIFLWHGTEDTTSPVSLVRTMAQTLPYCTPTFYAGEAHFSTALNHAEEILKTLAYL